ncbi:hypothetical protein NYO67_5877 [Aspergillus flavus]|nr:hypothetical protein NYO67_5877 [Aspergillus flavus]
MESLQAPVTSTSLLKTVSSLGQETVILEKNPVDEDVAPTSLPVAGISAAPYRAIVSIRLTGPVAGLEMLNAEVRLATIRIPKSAAGKVATIVPRIRNAVGPDVVLVMRIVRMGRV